MHDSGWNGGGILQELPWPGNSAGGPFWTSRTSGTVDGRAVRPGLAVCAAPAGRQNRVASRNAKTQAGIFFMSALLFVDIEERPGGPLAGVTDRATRSVRK
jgi:hypothetical protein